MVERRAIELAHTAQVGHGRRGHVGPGLAAVAGHLHDAVVRAGPDQIAVLLARGQREHRAVDLRAVHVVRDRTARIPHRLRVVPRQVAADRVPRVAAVGRLPHALRRGVEHVRVGVREDDRVGPLPPLLDVPRRLTGEEAGVGAHFLQLARALVVAREERAVVRAGEVQVGIARVRCDVAGLAAARLVGRHRWHAAEAARARVARHAQRAVVLLRTAHVERDMRGGDHVVELRGREVLVAPRELASGRHVERDGAAAVVAVDHVVRVVGIDPQVVVVAVGAGADRRQRLAGIGRAEERRVLHVDHVLAVRVGEHVRVVERALPHAAGRVHQRPARACVVTHEQAAVLVLHQRVDAAAVGARHGHADAPHHARGQARRARDLGPGVAAVGALEKPAARAATRHLVLDTIRLPQRCVDHARVLAVDRQIYRAGLAVAEEHALPALAAVDALEHAALIARAVVVAEGGHVDDVGVGRVDADLRDGFDVLEAHVRPGLAGVGRLVDAVARHDVAANARLAHADEHHIGVRFRHRQRTHR